MKQENLDKVITHLEKRCGFLPIATSNKRKQIPHVIFWKGKQVKLLNGKSLWPSLGAAKTAISDKISKNQLIQECELFTTEDITSQYRYYNGKVSYYFSKDFTDKQWKEILDILQKNGILEFRKVEDIQE